MAVLVRAAVAGRVGSLYPDGAVELELARALSQGQWQHALGLRFPPLFAGLVALVSRVSGCGLEPTAVWVTTLLSALVAPACALAAAELAPPARSPARLAFTAGLLAALQPWLARLGGQVMAYGVAHAALALALWLAVRAAVRGSPGAAAGAGALVGVGYLARADALASGAGLGLALLLARSGQAPRRRAASLLGFGAACLLVMSPYLLAIHHHSGAWRLSLKKEASVLVGLPRGPAAPRSAPAQDGLDVHLLIRSEERPGDPGALTPVGGFPLGSSLVYASDKVATAAHPLVVGLFLLGVLLPVAAGGRWVAPLALGAFVAAQTLLKAHYGYTHTPHCAAAGVLVVPQAALALLWLGARLPGRRGGALLLALTALILLPKALEPQLAHRTAEPALGRFLRRAWGPGALVICGRGTRVVAHYAGADYLPLPHGPPARALELARAAGADLLVIQVRQASPDPRAHALERALEALGLRPLPHGFSARDRRRGRRYEWLVYRLRPRDRARGLYNPADPEDR